MSWKSFEQARQQWQIDWWKQDGCIDFPHPEAPTDRPIYASKEGWYYYGDWLQVKDQTFECHGRGVFLFPNGRLYVGQVDRDCCHGRGRLMWLPNAPTWQQETRKNLFKQRKEPFDGRPFNYKGKFVSGEKEDARAVITFRDGTKWEGRFREDQPVEHEDDSDATPAAEAGANTPKDASLVGSRTAPDEDDDEEREDDEQASVADSSTSDEENTQAPCEEPYWLTCHEARQVSHGQAEWWKALDEELPPCPRPIWYNPENDWMYCGGFQDNHFQGKGALYFPNGRLLLASFEKSRVVGIATLLWLPAAPAWRKNVQDKSPLGGLPYVYHGYIHQNVRSDPQAVVALKDGTVRMGPWNEDVPVGDWWTEHSQEIPPEKQIDFEQLFAFAFEKKTSSDDEVDEEQEPALPVSPAQRQTMMAVTEQEAVGNIPRPPIKPTAAPADEHWLTLEEARQRSYGQVAWWKCAGPNGEVVQEKQYCNDAPEDRPVRWQNGFMYLGGWNEKAEYEGFGVFYFPNGRVFAGHMENSVCHGPATLLWVPEAPFWVANSQSLSVIKTKSGEGLPYIYMGLYKNSEKNDPNAMILLKDGTTHVGPFAHDNPVGDWSKWPPADSPASVDDLLSFGSTPRAIPESPKASKEAAAVQKIEPRPEAAPERDEEWLTFEEARDRSHGKTDWWKCPAIDGTRIPQVQQHLHGPADRPVWCNSKGWMYLGGWDILNDRFAGLGVFLFPNGRVFVGNFDQGKWSGPGKLVWLPDSPAWVRNEQSLSVVRKNDVGLPYLYFGKFSKGERCDDEATVVLKDGTTRVGPFRDSSPVGDWWRDHRAENRSPKDVEELVSFSQDWGVLKTIKEDDETSATNSVTSLSSEQAEGTVICSSSLLSVNTSAIDEERESWITLSEAQARTYGNVQWWKCRGASGEQIEERQHHSDGPSDRPIWLDANGSMYLGGWKDDEYFGPCVLYFPDGRVFVTSIEENKCSGPSKLIWLPESPCWVQNEDPRSVIRRELGHKRSLPYIYIGNFEDSAKNDPCATVILKGGITRRGPFRDDEPVGDWWRDHEASTTGREEMSDILCFESSTGQVKKTVSVETSEPISDADAYLRTQQRNEKLTALTAWLAKEVIGYNALQEDMDAYAHKLLDCGLHSGEMIKDLCTEQDVEKFGWMKMFHQRLLVSYLRKQTISKSGMAEV